MSGPPAKQAKTPQPTPRTRTAALPRISTPGTKTSSKASVPNSDEFSEEEEEDEWYLPSRRGPSQDPHGTSTRAKQAKTPQPTPRTRTAALPRISTPGTKTSSKASVPNSDEDSEEEEEDEGDLPSRSPQVFGPQRVLLQSSAARPSPAPWQQTPARGPALVSAANRKSALAAVTSVVTAADSEDVDWS
ncbi:hypothetical protein NHX12_020959, partial [Muraenolepis orangiensis]